jgi:hypothetical protein
MKTSLILLAALTAGLATAQQDSKPPDTSTKTATPDSQAKTGAPDTKDKDNPRTKPPRQQACSDLPPSQQVRFHLPAAMEQQLARQRAELERKTGIVLPPPPPPKVLPPCPPKPAKPAEEGKK